MRFRTLGSTGVTVSELTIGTSMLGALGNPDHDQCVEIIHAGLDAGINLVDTSDAYSRGESETIVGKALVGRRDEVVLATKFHVAMADGPNHSGNNRRWIVREVENSLRRLGTDHIDLYQAHRPDPWTDIEDTLSALDDLVRAGKVLYAGCSTYPAELIVESRWAAARRGFEPFRIEQPPYSIFAREIEQAVLPTCERYEMGVLAWSPLNGGWLTGRYSRGEVSASGRMQRNPLRFDLERPDNQRKLELTQQLEALAAKAGTNLIGLALGFVLAHRAITTAIIGPRTLEQLNGILAAGVAALDDEVLDLIDEMVAPGTNVSTAEGGWVPPWIERSSYRRRNAPQAPGLPRETLPPGQRPKP
jgi:aryl-alcohol dehydrogenase-like predicted oxidoreductase